MIVDWFKKKRVVLTGPRVKVWLFAREAIVKSNATVLVSCLITPGYMKEGMENDKRN